MIIEMLKEDRIKEFISYCKKHRNEVDDSFLNNESLESFNVTDENPTYVLIDNGEIKGAVSLIIDEYHKSGRKGRFRIFHSEILDIAYYKMLLGSIIKHTEGLNKVFMFIPLENKELIKLINELNFNVERYSYLLVREDMEVSDFSLPEDYKIIPFQIGRDEVSWCEVRNIAFAKLQGNETPMTKEMVSKMFSRSDNIEGASMIMYHNQRPVGVIRGSLDEYEGSEIMNIGPLAIVPEYQGMGLGRALLRAVLNFARAHNYKRTILSVNAENERAKLLYTQEGFKQVEAVVCYKYDLKA